MGATFSRLKNWTTEILTDSDLNAEIDNILNNLSPSGVDDYSTNAAQMKIQTSPGGLGSESLATSLAGEIERLRFVIQRMIGSSVTYWYENPSSTLTDLVSVLGSGLPQNRIASGKTTGNSSQLNALIPSGSTASLTLTASAVTPFTYYVSGTLYSITASVTLAGLTLANGANSSVSVNKADMTGGKQYSLALGQYGTSIYVDGMNSGPSALVGQIAAFNATAAGVSEYFIGYIESTSAITNAWRGSFFNSASTAMPAAAFSDNDILRLQKLAWIFANTNSSLAVTYNNPTVSGAQPTSPAIGDYWFDLGNTAWKTYNGTSWNAANATLIGMSIQNTAACVAARTFDAYKAMSDLQSLSFGDVDANISVQAKNMFGKVSVFGKALEFGTTRPKWDITTNIKSGEAESASTAYYMYMDENGSSMMTSTPPMIRTDLQGLYYPTESWRCVGSVSNDSLSNLTAPVRVFRSLPFDKMLITDPAAYRTASTTSTLDITYPLNFTNYVRASVSTVAVNDTGATSVVVATVTLEPGMWALSALMEARSTASVATPSWVFGGITNDTAVGVAYARPTGIGAYSIMMPTNGGAINMTATGSIPMYPVVVTAQTTYKLFAQNNAGTNLGTPTMVASLTAKRLDSLGEE